MGGNPGRQVEAYQVVRVHTRVLTKVVNSRTADIAKRFEVAKISSSLDCEYDRPRSELVKHGRFSRNYPFEATPHWL